ncbi:hypothetical protein [Phycicoccus sp.]|uniref:hypothetical protein n=1 Tax=Phycicoccus sp. TaxID=1902410 RepID=UPI002C99F3E8|nr:hypothetical protein [Phycicoccus sp.]HMM93978.1 hypothetical protein [Phycicoccus sp.]
MSRQNPFSMHYQSVWLERAGDRRLPPWLRVTCVAYGSHRRDGHSPFKPGQLGLILGTPHPEAGVVEPMDKHNLQRAIKRAVEYGWLSPLSGSTCLVVPSHAVSGGMGKGAKCTAHSR